MEVNELRIGNYIKYHDKIIIIDTIYYDSINVDLYNNNQSYHIDEIQPIKLTKEMFDTKNDTEIHFNNVIFEFWHDKLYFTSGEGCQLSDEIKYLHELQNFVFLFSKKELDINKIKL